MRRHTICALVTGFRRVLFRSVVDISDPNHYSSGTNILTKGNFTKWEDLKGAPVCGIQGAFYNRKTSEEFGAEIVAFKGTAEALTALKQNRCVAFVYDDAFIVSRLAEAEIGRAHV